LTADLDEVPRSELVWPPRYVDLTSSFRLPAQDQQAVRKAHRAGQVAFGADLVKLRWGPFCCSNYFDFHGPIIQPFTYVLAY
jgi:hypothetical protein